MTILYSCRHDGDQFRITKFDSDMNPESSYLTDGEECECPAGVRPTCRHRQMLPLFIKRGAIGTGWFYDYDRGGWVDMGYLNGEPEGLAQSPTETSLDAGESPEPPAEPPAEAGLPHPLPTRPQGVTIRRRI